MEINEERRTNPNGLKRRFTYIQSVTKRRFKSLKTSKRRISLIERNGSRRRNPKINYPDIKG